VERLPGLGRRAEGQRVRPAAIVEVEVAPDGGARLGHIVVGSEIDLFVLDAAPQPLDEDVVPPGALAVHADRNAVPGEGRAGGTANPGPY
jgi:hypothetical protein